MADSDDEFGEYWNKRRPPQKKLGRYNRNPAELRKAREAKANAAAKKPAGKAQPRKPAMTKKQGIKARTTRAVRSSEFRI